MHLRSCSHRSFSSNPSTLDIKSTRSMFFSRTMLSTTSRTTARVNFLSKLKQRNSQLQVSPRTGGRIIKRYILPILADKDLPKAPMPSRRRAKSQIQLSKHYNLSSQILTVLQLLRKDLIRTLSKVTNNKKEILGYKERILDLKAKIAQDQSDSPFVKIPENMKTSMPSIPQLNKFSSYFKRTNDISFRLRKEKEISFAYVFQTVQLIHYSSILNFTNTLTGELLKGLSSSLKSFDSDSWSCLEMFNRYKQSVAQREENNQTKIGALGLFLSINQNIQTSLNLGPELREKIYKEITEINRYCSDKIRRLNRQINHTQQQRDKLQVYNEVLFKKKNNLITRIQAIKHVLKRDYNLKGFEDQETCKNCGETFKEDGVCYVHSSIWNGFEYCCCGKTSISSHGCTATKHQSSNSYSQPKRKKCWSCRNIGHVLENCPRDPNFKEIDDISKTLLTERSKKKLKGSHNYTKSAPKEWKF